MANDTALDEIEFLARSRRRVQVLEALRSGPRDRSDLQTETGAARATLGRILGDFERRGWVQRKGARYELTPLGAFLSTEFHSLLEGVATMKDFSEIAHLLPIDAFDFGLEHFADARITLSQLHDSVAPVRRSLAIGDETDCWRIVTPALAPQALELTWRLVTQNAGRFEGVFTERVLETILADDEMTRWLGEVVRSEGGEVFRYDGDVPCIISVLDELACLGLSDAGGAPRALVEIDDETVTRWAHRTIDDYRDRAELIDPGSL